MAEDALKEYVVDVNGNKTTMRLSEEEARRYGAAEAPAEPQQGVKADTSTPNKASAPSANKASGSA